MTTFGSSAKRPTGVLLGLAMAMALVGCDSPAARFRLNMVFLKKQEETVSAKIEQAQKEDIADALTALFGTPDDPYIEASAEAGMAGVVDASKVAMAAGPVGSDELGRPRGLYRQHCVHCHGISGDGMGPTAAFLNPYPRDFRRGIFKFKSTPIGSRPTDDDLHRTLLEGIPGTAMPSFRVLHHDEIAALIDYVKYLSIRGEVERALMAETSELDTGEKLDVSKANLVDDKLALVVGRWQQADDQVTKVSPHPEWTDAELQNSIDRGRDLFFGKVANCFTCHGPTALGDGQMTDYDTWSKEFEDWTKPADAAARSKRINEFIAFGGLPPRNIIPRNLRQGVYRGGRRPVDLFWRIRNGIEGSPMPAATMQPPGNPHAPGLTTDDVWHVVDYVRSLPYEALSRPPQMVLENLRERN